MSKKDPAVFNVTSHGQTGGITAGQVIIGSPQRQLDDPSEAELAALTTRPSTQVMLIAYSADAETRSLSSQVHRFLHALGWDVYGVVSAATPPQTEVEIWSTGDAQSGPLAAFGSWLRRNGFDVLFHANEKGNQILLGPAR
jgi:hypothetical protein